MKYIVTFISADEKEYSVQVIAASKEEAQQRVLDGWPVRSIVSVTINQS